MRRFEDILALARFLERGAQRVGEAQREGLIAAGEDLVDHAKDMIGTEDESWPPLADSTIAQKQKLGFTGRVSATDPLLRTGELRATISYRVDGDRSVSLGSPDPISLYQELGTAKIPPRPFIGATMYRHGKEEAHTVMHYIMSRVAGKPLPRRKQRSNPE